MADPTPYLSTMTGTSATLVSIIGGLLVARFVGLDSEQQGAQKLVEEAKARLNIARQRADEARQKVERWDASDFLQTPAVLSLIKSGTTDLVELRRHADCYLEDVELTPYVDEVSHEFHEAKQYFAEHPLSPDEGLLDAHGEWHRVRRHFDDLPPIMWDEAWSLIFDETVMDAVKAAERRKAQQRRTGSFSLPSVMSGITPSMIRAITPRDNTDWRAIRARRYDAKVLASERADQQVQDLDNELVRLRQAHSEVVRPDGRMLWALVVLAVFTVVGVGLPLWVMSQGPRDITPHIRWLFWLFGGALATLLIYMALYLRALMTRRSMALGTPESSAPPAARALSE
ncbi:hypothetical protein [Streptomyces shenzhenensis]|uniref:hypothetical protein n=1 Tax=Streptomyces shenzhenensis TaxID=943815 RepID=UPI0015F052E4|nr:hypothetical protein [Streptomyces shenzhenensis]